MTSKINDFRIKSPLIPVSLFYLILAILSWHATYFGDNVQQISKEALWFYDNHFSSLLMPTKCSEATINATGYHPPLMGIMTAFLWSVFGHKIWVSHLFSCFWAILLFFNLKKLCICIFEEKYAYWIASIILLEPTLATQFFVASPDFILITSFVISLRAIFEQRPLLLSLGLFFLCGINMRGVFLGAILFFGYMYYLKKQGNTTASAFKSVVIPYLPIILTLSGYYIYYLSQKGWFFNNPDYSDHYSRPQNFSQVFHGLAALCLRFIENGRIILWLLISYFITRMIREKKRATLKIYFLSFIVVLTITLYVLFAFITKMPFSTRYFMPIFLPLTLLVGWFGQIYLSKKKQVIWLIVVLISELTGNFWIYPDHTSKAWDATLTHITYYQLRRDCFEFIDHKNIPYEEISGGFCFYGKRRFVEATEDNRTISKDVQNKKYFIYSNISNLEDDMIDELNNLQLWTPIKIFKSGVVRVIIYKRK